MEINILFKKYKTLLDTKKKAYLSNMLGSVMDIADIILGRVDLKISYHKFRNSIT